VILSINEGRYKLIGIYDCFGYGLGYDVSFEERYKLIRRAGFDCVMLWWSDQFGRGNGYQEDVRLARSAGLFVENIHAPVHEQDHLSLDNLSGESVFQSYLQCVEDCCEYNIPTIVIHLPNDHNPLNQTGIRRLGKLIDKAEQKNIQIAFENLSNINNLKMVLKKFIPSLHKTLNIYLFRNFLFPVNMERTIFE